MASRGCENWEQAESLLQRKAVELCLRKADIPRSKVDIAFAGDLQAQCTASNYTMQELGIPFAGVYGACSTIAETLGLAAVFAAGGMAERVLALTSSHFCAAERQFRTPLEYGAKRTPHGPVDGHRRGACLVRAHGSVGVPVLSVTFGRVQDFAVHDINNMGAAMMPAAASTLLRTFFRLRGQARRISTQFLRAIWARSVRHFCMSRWPKRGCRWTTIRTAAAYYDTNSQNVQAGGGGRMQCGGAVREDPADAGRGRLRALFLATGALMSRPRFLQGGRSIPASPTVSSWRCGMSYAWAFVVGGAIRVRAAFY